MAGERKIRTPSYKKAPVDHKSCKFAEVMDMSSCYFLCYSFSSTLSPQFSFFYLSLFFPYFRFTAVLAPCNLCNVAVGAFSIVAPISGLWRRAEHSVLWVCSLERLAQFCAGRKWCPWPSCKWWLLKCMTAVHAGVTKDIYILHKYPLA